jgi:hypothetical protein
LLEITKRADLKQFFMYEFFIIFSSHHHLIFPLEYF